MYAHSGRNRSIVLLSWQAVLWYSCYSSVGAFGSMASISESNCTHSLM